MAEVIKIDSKTWRIEDGGVRFFLLEGDDKALMIDSGMNTPDAVDIVSELTDKPIELLNTHADRDHISGNMRFEKTYMSPNERENYEFKGNNEDAGQQVPQMAEIVPVKTGDIIDLGNRELEIIDNPGHTPGSIAILDLRNRVLYSGDAVSDANIFMFGQFRNINLYVNSLETIQKYSGRYDVIYPSHGTIPIAPNQVEKLIEGAKSIIAGEAGDRAKTVDIFGNEVTLYEFDYAGFLI